MNSDTFITHDLAAVIVPHDGAPVDLITRKASRWHPTPNTVTTWAAPADRHEWAEVLNYCRANNITIHKENVDQALGAAIDDDQRTVVFVVVTTGSLYKNIKPTPEARTAGQQQATALLNGLVEQLGWNDAVVTEVEAG